MPMVTKGSVTDLSSYAFLLRIGAVADQVLLPVVNGDGHALEQSITAAASFAATFIVSLWLLHVSSILLGRFLPYRLSFFGRLLATRVRGCRRLFPRVFLIGLSHGFLF